MRGISLKAIAIALIATFALDIVSGIALTAILGGESLAPEMTEQQTADAIVALTTTRAFLTWSFVLGTLSTVVGGYIAVRIAKTVPYLNALAFGVLGIVFGALMAEGLPLWFNVLGFALVLPAALLGGHIAKRRIKGNA